ncbi:MAG: YciI family protein [Bacteroidota bacterium]
MKQLLVFLFVILNLAAAAQDKNAESKMKQYFLVILTKGPNRTQDSVTVNRIQAEHLKNIGRLYEEGKLDLAGPFGDDTDWRGVFVFNVETQEEVEKLLQTDVAISSGRLSYIIHPWWSQKGAMLR